MAYPSSSDVTAGQPTAHEHYNYLRSDALYLAQLAADAVPLGTFFSRFIQDVIISYLATNRLRVAYSATMPPTLMIGGVMCQAAASVDLAASSFSGAAATWYVFAKRTAGATTFSLEVNTSAVETSTTRLIGQVYWDGTNLNQNLIKTYGLPALPIADYDSGWFACAYNNTYTKAHGLGTTPRHVVLVHAAAAAPGAGDEQVHVNSAYQTSSTGPTEIIGKDGTNIYVQCPNQASYGTCWSIRRTSASGYYRILAWI